MIVNVLRNMHQIDEEWQLSWKSFLAFFPVLT